MQSYTLRVSGYDTNIVRNERDVQQLVQTFHTKEQVAKKAGDQIRGQDVQRQNVELVYNDYRVSCFYCDQNHWAKDCPNRQFLPQRKEQSYSWIKKSCDNNRKEKSRQRRRNDSSDDESKKVRRDDRSRSSTRHRSPIKIYININFKQ